MWRMRVVHATGLRLQVARSPRRTRGAVDTAIGLPQNGHPQPRRDGSGDPLLPLRRTTGHRGDGLRPARPAHRVEVTSSSVVETDKPETAQAKVSWADLSPRR